MDVLQSTLKCLCEANQNEISYIRSELQKYNSASEQYIWNATLARKEYLQDRITKFKIFDLCQDTRELMKLVHTTRYCKTKELVELDMICSKTRFIPMK